MDRNAVILVTGAAGFIGSCMTGYLNRKGYYNIIIVDDFSDEQKKKNYNEKKICARVDRDELFDWLDRYQLRIDFIFHLGAQIDMDSTGNSVFEKFNVEYSKKIWNYCIEKNIPLVYSSSSVTYGDGKLGYSDSNEITEKLNPADPYAISKNEFDKWVLKQSSQPPFWAGLKFFDVYGPNEYHKQKGTSIILKLFNEASSAGGVKLLKSQRPEYKDGEQLRDFVYVKDVVDVCYWMMQQSVEKNNASMIGLYNLGTGKARSFNDVANAIFKVLNKRPSVEYIDHSPDSKDDSAYFMEADIAKLRSAGYKKDFYSLEEGVSTYATHFLIDEKYY